MTADRWIQLLAIVVAVLGVSVPVILRRADRQLVQINTLAAEIKTLEATNQALRDANTDLKIQLMGLQRVGQVVDRTFSNLPASRLEGDRP